MSCRIFIRLSTLPNVWYQLPGNSFHQNYKCTVSKRGENKFPSPPLNLDQLKLNDLFLGHVYMTKGGTFCIRKYLYVPNNPGMVG